MEETKSMTASEMLTEIQDNILVLMYDLSNGLVEETNYDAIDANISTFDSLTTIAKRIGEIAVLDIDVKRKEEKNDGNDFNENE